MRSTARRWSTALTGGPSRRSSPSSSRRAAIVSGTRSGPGFARRSTTGATSTPAGTTRRSSARARPSRRPRLRSRSRSLPLLGTRAGRALLVAPVPRDRPRAAAAGRGDGRLPPDSAGPAAADAAAVLPLAPGRSRPVRAASSGSRSILGVGSWDHLTTKGLIHEVPDRVLVWNEAQKHEAIELHDVPADRVLVTGSQAYDHWFSTRPSVDREAFCRQVGLDPARPFLLYLCSSPFIAPHEVGFVRRWIAAIRASADPRLRTRRPAGASASAELAAVARRRSVRRVRATSRSGRRPA